VGGWVGGWVGIPPSFSRADDTALTTRPFTGWARAFAGSIAYTLD